MDFAWGASVKNDAMEANPCETTDTQSCFSARSPLTIDNIQDMDYITAQLIIES